MKRITPVRVLEECLDLMWRLVETEHQRHDPYGSIKACPNNRCMEAVEIVNEADHLEVFLQMAKTLRATG